MSEGWRELYEQMGVDADEWDEDPLEDLRERQGELAEIAESDAPDAPVARVMLRLIQGERLHPEELAAIQSEGMPHA